MDLKQIDKVEILNLHGNNILKIRTADQGIELARFSKRQADKFNEAKFKIEELVQTEKGEDQKIGTRPKNTEFPQISIFPATTFGPKTWFGSQTQKLGKK